LENSGYSILFPARIGAQWHTHKESGAAMLKQAQKIVPELISPSDAADMLALKRTSIYQLLRAGEIDAIKIGRKTCVRVSSLRAFIERQPRAMFQPASQRNEARKVATREPPG
jgi:excisionase family DNA binding protein